MSLLRKEVDGVVADIVIPEPIFKVSTSGDGSRLSFSRVNSIKNNSLSPITLMVMDSITLIWDGPNSKYKVNVKECQQAVESNIVSDIIFFIRNRMPVANVRLTSLYKWYTTMVDERALIDYPELSDILYETWKYVNSNNMNDEKHRKNAFGILEVIKQKFENKGLKR